MKIECEICHRFPPKDNVALFGIKGADGTNRAWRCGDCMKDPIEPEVQEMVDFLMGEES